MFLGAYTLLTGQLTAPVGGFFGFCFICKHLEFFTCLRRTFNPSNNTGEEVGIVNLLFLSLNMALMRPKILTGNHEIPAFRVPPCTSTVAT